MSDQRTADTLLRELFRATHGVLDPLAVSWEVVRRTGEHFGVSRCLFAEIEPAGEYAVVHRDYAVGVMSGAGRHRMELFGAPLIADMKAGRTIVITDVATDARTQGPVAQMSFGALQIRSVIAVNLLQDGRLVASLQVQHEAPRRWRPAEVRLLEKVAERSWFAFETARATAALQENRAVLALAMRGGRMGAWSRRFPDEIWWSPELCEIHGIAPESAPRTEEESLRCVHPDDRQALMLRIRADVAARRDHVSECRFRHASGEWRWLELRARAAYEEDGTPAALHGIAVDITARKDAELALRDRESRYRSLVDASGAIVFTSDGNANWLERNPAWEAYTGQTFEQYRGHGWAAAVHPDDVARLQRSVAAAIAAASTWTDEARLWHARSGSYRHQETRGVPMLAADGSVRAWVGTVSDVHARKLAEAALRAADQRKDEFIATLAHELRNPLAPISNALALLEAAGDDAALWRKCREIMSRQVRQMTRLVDELMDLSRVNSGRIKLQRAPVALAVPIGDALESIRGAVAQRRQVLETDFAAGDACVDGDAARLAQVFTNLLANASKFTPEGGRIVVRTRIEAADVVVAVIDEGVGIPPDRIDSVFEMFTQIDSGLDRRHQGLGVGLTIARQLTEMHGGAIRAASDGPGRGSRFEVRLPRLTGAPAVAETAPVPALSPRRILVVDDNRDSADSLTQVLGRMGNEVRAAYDGPSALQLGEGFRPEVVLLDIGMPGMHGYAVASSMRERAWGSSCVLVALTGWGQPADKERALESGCDGHLVKPFDMASFARLVEEAGRSRPHATPAARPAP